MHATCQALMTVYGCDESCFVDQKTNDIIISIAIITLRLLLIVKLKVRLTTETADR